MSKIIEMNLSLVDKGQYPHPKEWFSKYNFHGNDFEALLRYKKSHLKSIELKALEGSLYFNQKLIVYMMKDYYDPVFTWEQFHYFSKEQYSKQ